MNNLKSKKQEKYQITNFMLPNTITSEDLLKYASTTEGQLMASTLKKTLNVDSDPQKLMPVYLLSLGANMALEILKTNQ